MELIDPTKMKFDEINFDEKSQSSPFTQCSNNEPN